MASKRRKMVQQNSQYSSEKMATLFLAMNASTNAVAAGVAAGRGAGGGACEGVEAAISFSSSVMSAGMSSNRGVERYRSPVSASIARIRVPSGAPAARRSAHASVPPPDVPVKMPSLRARSRATDIASSPPTWSRPSKPLEATTSDTSLGIQSGAQPCSRWGRHTGCTSAKELVPEASAAAAPSGYWVAKPEWSRGALSGSHTWILVPGDLARSTRDTPLRVPPVP
mmetsp:Transcript_52040/g.129604  ORF Transcript_52040/g.129604 Transcript_52040/m.129604 type:complete len:226 (-) Transcript_52040:682-1359(-)